MIDLLRQYARWSDNQYENSFDEPMLIGFTKATVFVGIPMILILVAALAVLITIVGLALGILVRVIPWLWDLVWI